MATLYLKFNFNCNIFATSAEDRKELKTKDEKTISDIILNYRCTSEGTLKHSYDIIIEPDDLLKGSDIELSISTDSKISVKGIAKIKPKADLCLYLLEGEKQKFFLSSVCVNPSYAKLYPSKNGKPIEISCEVSKKKPSM
tara:strand:+ start:71 stop:490 length:420 start_codon:yes stop_codon:yes gene_type:complete